MKSIDNSKKSWTQCSADEIVKEIEKRKNRGYGFTHFQAYMASIQDPHKRLKSIHIAGTNGKGSTTNDIRAILQEAGYQVGSFTSPYMISHYDRIRINDQNIPKECFMAIVQRHYEDWIHWDLSMFEIDMCIAVLYFLEQDVDFCVFETGLGGRLDSTNILFPMITVITNIGLDHMELLGDTVEKIAAEKAGIIKDRVDLITAETDPACLAVFQAANQAHHSSCIQIQPVENVKDTVVGISFNYRTYQAIQLQTHAIYQSKNAALAIETVLYLCKHQLLQVEESHIRNGLRKANWIGRFEIIQQEPFLLLDGAHNVPGIKALVQSLQGAENVRIIFSVLKDKNFDEMLQELRSLTDDIVLTPFHNERALDMHVLEDKYHLHYEADYKTAITNGMAEGKGLVVTGSLYFISEVREYLMKNKDMLKEMK